MGGVLVRERSTMATKFEDQLKRSNIEIFAHVWRAVKESSDEVQQVVQEMLEIVNDPEAEMDDRQMAIDTIDEALFPTTRNGGFGIDLEDLEEDDRREAGQLVEEMDREEATFADRVKELLDEKGWTQQDLAEAIGVKQPAVSMMLSRDARPQQRTVIKIAEALGVASESLWPSGSREEDP